MIAPFSRVVALGVLLDVSTETGVAFASVEVSNDFDFALTVDASSAPTRVSDLEDAWVSATSRAFCFFASL